VYRIPITFHKRLTRGETPVAYCVINTQMGDRVYAEKEMGGTFEVGALLANGSYLADGTSVAGGDTVDAIDKAARVSNFGSFERTIQPRTADVLAAYGGKQLQHISVDLINTDRYFSRLIATEPFLGRPINIYAGFPQDPPSEHISLFQGIISRVTALEIMTVEAEERGGDGTGAALANRYYLPRASRYTNALAGNDRLPDVYGDLTDGTQGVWNLPCIDTVNFVYAFAGFAVLSVANGNTINVYADGALVDPGGYTFNESVDYEGEGMIATITFDADQANAAITARGMGKAAGATLIENIIDLIDDLLTVSNSFTSALYESTAYARARQIFEAQGYAAAGVIDEDVVLWDVITVMMSAFLGNAFLNGEGKLVLEIDNNRISQYGQPSIIPSGETELLDASYGLENVINQVPANFAYNYAQGEFKRHTDDTAHADDASRGVYGTRKPNMPWQLYWCRDLTVVQAIQDLIVEKFAWPLWEIEIEDKTLKRLGIDVGDLVVHTVDSLYDTNGDPLDNHYWRVISVNPDFTAGTITFRAVRTQYFLTIAYIADGTYIADGSILAGMNRDTTKF